ncbi:MAG: flavodoxin domain-containing protein [Coriobacteriales bacterium]|jgi:menaquinone-dependent protoporphyrinogen oxidase|nr:flavodoxin domain-containing protein [Coriobacteriales bacterium]
MKTLVLYATKYGAARKIAESLAESLSDADLCNIKEGYPTNFAKYDCVIIGSSVYAGSIRPEAKAFIAQAVSALEGKRLGLFICGMDAQRYEDCLKKNYPAEILQQAVVTDFLGGIFDPAKANFAERTIFRAASKLSSYQNTIDVEKIKQFAQAMET